MGSLSEFHSKGWITIARLNTGCLVKFEFQINYKYYLTVSMF